jgi:RecA-family ATPase
MAQYADVQTSTAWRLESSLREFGNFKPVNFWFEYPIHRVDDTGVLQKIYASGDPKSNLEKSGKRKQTTESRRDEFETAFEINMNADGTCSVSVLAEYLGVTDRTVRKRVKEFEDDYINNHGVISPRKPKVEQREND